MADDSRKLSRLKTRADTLLQSGQLEAACSLYVQVCELIPTDADAWVSLGIMQRRLQQFAASEKSCRKALSLEPGHSRGRQALGAALQQQGYLNEAIASYRDAVRLDPELEETWYFLANALRQAGQDAGASDAYRHLLDLNPDHFEGLNNFGSHLRVLGEADEAIGRLRHALGLKPDSVETMTNLGDAYVARSRYEEALELLHRATVLRPDFANAFRALGNAQHHAGRLREALSSYDRALVLRPGWRIVNVARAKILEQLGEHRQAFELLSPLLADGFDPAIPVYFDVSKHVGGRDEAVTALEGYLADRPDMRPDAAAAIHFQLGRHYDEAGEYEDAFQHFEQANRNTAASYDREAQARLVDEIIKTYSPSFVSSMARACNDSSLPIFIVGMPRSGTSLVEQILASHAAVFGAGELPDISRLAQELTQTYPGFGFPAYARLLDTAVLESRGSRYIERLVSLAPDALRITDKMPYNLPYVGLMAQMFPAARVIQCERHPLDTCLSCYFADFGTVGHAFSYGLESVADFYIQYQRLLDHWGSLLPDSVMRIRYADLVSEQDRYSRQLVDFCGLEWDDRCLEFHKTDRFVFTLSYDQVRQPMYTRSMDRWKHYEKFIGPMRDRLEAAGIQCD